LGDYTIKTGIFMNAKSFTFFIFSVFALASCGGGGGDNTTPPTVITPGWEPPSRVGASLIMDANGDGHNDIIINASGGVEQTHEYNSMELYLNDGQGQFTIKEDAFPITQFAGKNYILYQDKINANNDGLDDIIAIETNQEERTIFLHLYLANSNGIYTDASMNITNANYSEAAAELRVADFDGDGFEDFVLTGFSFICNPSDTELTDRYENCYGGTIYINDGDGNFSPQSMELTESETGVTYTAESLRYSKFSQEDLDDGYRPGFDMGTPTNWANGMIAQLNIADLDNDDKIDIVSHTFSSTSMLPSFINNSTPGNLAFEVRHSNNVPRKNGVLIDINRDGFTDWLVSEEIYSYAIGTKDDVNETVPLSVLINDGTGIFTQDDSFLVGDHYGVQHARIWLVADFDNDGFDDLVIPDHGNDWRPYPGFRNTLLMNTDLGLVDVTATGLSTEKTYSHSGAVGDVNGDGYADIFFNNTLGVNEGNVEAIPEKRLWLNNGNGTFTPSEQDL
jgi:hypothetical protein